MDFVDPIVVALLMAGLWYLLVHAALVVGLLRRYAGVPGCPPAAVSVVVAARNEEATIGLLLDCLRRQTYPHTEFILVNDRSADGTGRIIAEACAQDARFKQIDIRDTPTDMPAKKNALRRGIEASSGSILCFTDADCLPGPRWVEKLVRQFDERTGLVAGYSPYLEEAHPGVRPTAGLLRALLYRFIAYEELRGGLWAAGSIGLGLGWLCTGRNLAYRREVYDAVGGFERIKMSVSGDDDLFLQLVRRETPWRVRYCLDRENHVPTYPPTTFRRFVEQRTRHFSAGKFFSLAQKAFFLLYHSANLLLLASLFFFIFWPAGSKGMLVGFGLKLVADIFLLVVGADLFHQSRLGMQFLPMEFLYVLYNTLIGPLGFVKRFQWKPV